MTTVWGPIVYPVALDSLAPALIDNVDEVIANHPNSLATAIRALETKLGITNAPVTGLGGVSFDPAGKAANPGVAGSPTIWVDNSGGPGFTLFYTDDLGSTYSLQASGVTIDDWTPATGYTVDREVMYVGLRFRCLSAHTSGGTFFNDTDLSKWVCVSGEGIIVNQVAHGFSELDVIYSNAGVWTAAQANAVGTLSVPPMLVIGVGTAVNYFLAAQDQIVTVSLHGLVVDDIYYLSEAVAGQLTNTEPTGAGNYSNPICRVLSANTLAILPNRPVLQTALVTSTLDVAYDGGGSGAGRAITADQGAVTVTVPDTSNNAGLEITQNDVTNDPVAMTITNAGDGSCLAIANAGSGAAIDLQGVGSRKISSTSANLTIETVTSGYIYLDSAGAATIESDSDLTLDSSGSVYIQCNSGFGGSILSIYSTQGIELAATDNLNMYGGTGVTITPYSDLTGTFLNVYDGGGTGGMNSAAGTDIWANFQGRFEQSGTAGYTVLQIDTNEQTTGSGTRLLLDAKYETVSKFNVDIDGITDLAAIDFDITATPSVQEGRMYWNATTKTLDLGLTGGQVVLQVGQEGHAYVRNQSGATINNGDAVYAVGASGNKILIAPADSTDADKVQVFGMATEDIANNANGYVALWGVVRGSATQPVDTNSFSEGDKLYLSTAGTWTNTHPSTATEAVIVLGVVRRKHASLGEIHLHIYPFTIGNNFDGTMRQGIINKSTGTSAAVGFTAVNDQNHWMTVGIGGSNNATFGEAAIFYGPGYADNWYAVDGNKSHKWFVDPTDSHNNSSLSYLSMELDSSGHLTLGRGQFTSTLTTGTSPLNVTSTTLNTNLNADLLDGQHGSYYETYAETFSNEKSADFEMHGFVDNTETSIGFNDGTYTFTLTDAGGGWSYYRGGIKYTISGNKTTTLSGSPPTADDYYVYIDATDGTLSNSTTPWDFSDLKVPVAIIRWNNALTPKYVLLEERHTCVMNIKTHHYEHDTFGTRLQSSGAITGYVLGSDVDANKQFDIAQTKIWDEDLQSTLAAITGGVDDYHIAYRTGVGTWEWKEDSMPFDYTVAGYINYDNAGTMTQGQNNKFYTTYLIATNNQGIARFVTIHGQSEFDSLIEAQNEQFTDLTLDGLPITEGVAIWKFIWDTSSSYTSTGKCELEVAPIPVNSNVTTATAPPGLGTMATQDADNVSISGGDIVGLTTLDVGSTVTLVGTIDDDTMGTATDTTLATSESIKAYVDSAVTVSAGSASELLWNNAGTVDGTDGLYWDDSNDTLMFGDQTAQGWSSSGHASQAYKTSGTLGHSVIVIDPTTTYYPFFLLLRTGGSYASPGATPDGAIIGQFIFQGHQGTTWTNQAPGAQIEATASELWNNSAAGTDLEFKTCTSTTESLETRYKIDGDTGNHIWYGAGATPSELMRLDAANARLGIGTNDPQHILHVASDAGVYTVANLTYAGSGDVPCYFTGRKAKGDLTTPTAVGTGEWMATYEGAGYINGGYNTVGAMRFKTTGTHSTYLSGECHFYLRDSANSWATRAIITSTGRLGVGTDSPGGTLGLVDANTYITRDGSNNLSFTDLVTGTKTLAELATDTVRNPAGTGAEIQYRASGTSFGAANMYWDTTNEGLAIGVATTDVTWEATPNYSMLVHMAGDSGDARDMNALGIENGSGASFINFYNTDPAGTLASRAAVGDTDSLGGIYALGWTSDSKYFRGGAMLFAVDGTPGTNYVPAKFQIQLSDALASAKKTRYEILSGGDHIWYGGGVTPATYMTLSGTSGLLTLEGDLTLTSGGTIASTSNGDITLNAGSGTIKNSSDYFTDSVLSQDSNTFFGVGVTPAGLSHGSGSEGYYNTNIGYAAGDALTTGYRNTSIGCQAGSEITEGFSNACFGYQAGIGITTGDGNLCFGPGTGTALANGVYNICMGVNAGQEQATDYAVYIGVLCGQYANGNGNTGIGYSALQGVTGTSTGAYNVGIGAFAGEAITTGGYNVFIGRDAGLLVTEGAGGVYLGYQAGDNVTTGDYGVILGYGVDADSATADYQLNICNVIKNSNWNTGGDLIFTPQGTGITAVGANNTSQTLNSPNDLFVNGKLEVDGIAYFDGGAGFYSYIYLPDDIPIVLGTSSNTTIEYNTAQTNNALEVALDNTNNTLIVCNLGNKGQNFALANQSDPTLVVFASSATSVLNTRYMTLAHNGTDGLISTGGGNIQLLPVAGSITQIGDAGSTSHTLNTNDDLFVSGKFEVDGIAYFDGGVRFPAQNVIVYDQVAIEFGSSQDCFILYSTSQTPDALVIAPSIESRNIIITDATNRNNDHAHALQTNPTLWINSATDPTGGDATQWRSQSHNQTDSFDGIGSGSKVTEHEAPVELADDASFDLPDASAGYGRFLVDDGEEYADIYWSTDGTVQIVNSSTNVKDSDLNGYFCIFDNGTAVRVRNRLGSAKTVMFDYHFTTSP